MPSDTPTPELEQVEAWLESPQWKSPRAVALATQLLATMTDNAALRSEVERWKKHCADCHGPLRAEPQHPTAPEVCPPEYTCELCGKTVPIGWGQRECAIPYPNGRYKHARFRRLKAGGSDYALCSTHPFKFDPGVEYPFHDTPPLTAPEEPNPWNVSNPDEASNWYEFELEHGRSPYPVTADAPELPEALREALGTISLMVSEISEMDSVHGPKLTTALATIEREVTRLVGENAAMVAQRLREIGEYGERTIELNRLWKRNESLRAALATAIAEKEAAEGECVRLEHVIDVIWESSGEVIQREQQWVREVEAQKMTAEGVVLRVQDWREWRERNNIQSMSAHEKGIIDALDAYAAK